MRQQFEIPGRLAGLNEYTRACRANRQLGARMKRENQDAALRAIKAARLRPMRCPVDVHCTWYEKPGRGRLRDKDNIQMGVKFVLDALVEAGIIPDDGWGQIGRISHDCFRASGEAHILIELEEA